MVLWSIARIVVILLALATLLVTAVFVTGPSGTTVLADGAIADLVALAVIVVAGISLWRDLRPRPR